MQIGQDTLESVSDGMLGFAASIDWAGLDACVRRRVSAFRLAYVVFIWAGSHADDRVKVTSRLTLQMNPQSLNDFWLTVKRNKPPYVTFCFNLALL